MTKRIDVVGAVIKRNRKILLAQRKCENLHGKWEFPGGKVEANETHKDALVREILEEMNIAIAVKSFISTSLFSINGKDYSLSCYWADLISGEIQLNEHNAIIWVKPGDLLEYDLAEPDIPVALEINNN